VLRREAHHVQTPWGTVLGKVALLPDGSRRFAAEYADCHRIAVQQGKPLAEIMAAAQAAFRAAGDA
jgi:uncharacterized protein (DUF111 family)